MSNKLLSFLIPVAIVTAIIVVVVVFNMASRSLSSNTVVEKTYSPRPGIECLIVTSSDGVATSCYSTANLPAQKVK